MDFYSATEGREAAALLTVLLGEEADIPVVDPELPSPTAPALPSLPGGQVDSNAATEGREAAALLTVLLGGEAGIPDTATVPGAIIQVAQLQPLRDAALPLIATLLTLTIETSTAEFDPGEFDGEASAAVSFLPETSIAAGQSLPEPTDPGEGEGDGQEGPNTPEGPILPVPQAPSPWQPSSMGLDEALDQFCRDHLDQFLSPDKSTTGIASPRHVPEETSDHWQQARTPLEARASVGRDTDHLPLAYQEQMIDEAIRSLWSDESRPTQTSHTPTPVPLTPGRNIPTEIGPTVATVSSNEPINSREGGLLSWWERGYELLTGFAVSLWAAAVAMAKSSDTQTSTTLLAMLRQDPRRRAGGGVPTMDVGATHVSRVPECGWPLPRLPRESFLTKAMWPKH